ncbi:MAG: type II secretion system protein J [Rhodopila sp.]
MPALNRGQRRCQQFGIQNGGTAHQWNRKQWFHFVHGVSSVVPNRPGPLAPNRYDRQRGSCYVIKTSSSAQSGLCMHRRGFTLLEVLAALAIGGLVLSLLVAGLRYSQSILQSRERLFRSSADFSAVDRTLRTIIEAAAPGGGGGGESRFVGAPHTLSFRTTMPAGLDSSYRTADVNIGVDAGRNLGVSWRPWFRNWIMPPPSPRRIDLLAGIDRLDCGYWSPAMNVPSGEWLTAWNGVAPPKLVRLRLVFPAESGLRWSDIIVATARDPRVN